MSALNPIIFTLKNPQQQTKEPKELCLTEKTESIFEIPSHLLQRAIQTCETKTELVVYMTILRYSLGFNRDKCTVSRRFIATWTGLQYQNVGRGVEGLIAKGLVEKLPESNVKHGDVFKVLHLSEGPMTRNQNDYTQPPKCNQLENTQGVIKVITESHQVDDEAASERLRSVINPITKNKKEDLEESSSVSEKFQKYLQSLPEIHMQKIERKCLNQLMENYSDTQIQMALEYAQKQGTTTGESIKLPLCYLARGSSMETILKVAEKRKATEVAKVQLVNLAEKRQELEAEKERKAEAHLKQAIQVFESAHPSPEGQSEVLTKIIQNKYQLINPTGKMARNLAILHWFKNIQQQQL